MSKDGDEDNVRKKLKFEVNTEQSKTANEEIDWNEKNNKKTLKNKLKTKLRYLKELKVDGGTEQEQVGRRVDEKRRGGGRSRHGSPLRGLIWSSGVLRSNHGPQSRDGPPQTSSGGYCSPHVELLQVQNSSAGLTHYGAPGKVLGGAPHHVLNLTAKERRGVKIQYVALP